VLELSPDLGTLFRRFHHSCVQRKIRRAEREHVLYEEGASDKVIREFYSLLIKTRRRHGLPPQPMSWFFNLRDAWEGAFKVRLATQSGRPIASIITILHKQSLTYKYGCSDARFHKLGGMPFLFWHSIQDAKRHGASKLDLGRSDLDNQGLNAFKEHLGAERSSLTYYRYPSSATRGAFAGTEFLSNLCSYLPESALRVAGKLLYRHIG
jgi:lipid II:glycine glycyltransferase (peptidoglycan interpeptide bridge formation enzyme)